MCTTKAAVLAAFMLSLCWQPHVFRKQFLQHLMLSRSLQLFSINNYCCWHALSPAVFRPSLQLSCSLCPRSCTYSDLINTVRTTILFSFSSQLYSDYVILAAVICFLSSRLFSFYEILAADMFLFLNGCTLCMQLASVIFFLSAHMFYDFKNFAASTPLFPHGCTLICKSCSFHVLSFLTTVLIMQSCSSHILSFLTAVL
jgi:hypothetical protein